MLISYTFKSAIKVKKLVSLTVCIALLLIVFASSAAVASNHAEDDHEIVPFYDEVCNGLPYHKMVSHWLGSAIVNGLMNLAPMYLFK